MANDDSHIIAEDIKTLHSMGYAQELARRMHGFSNFAISFSIICILSGGINSIMQATGGVGGAAIGIGWPVGCAVSFVFALGMAQIASAYPTAGGLYHWGSILGGVGWGWATAWLNLIGLVTVMGAINVGTWTFFVGAFGAKLGIEASFVNQAIFVGGITALQALINHFGIRLTTLLTDFSGYLIFTVAVALGLTLFAFAPSHDFSRLWTFKNYSGDLGGGVWPQTDDMFYLFGLGLLLPIYTITGFDASAHTSEETIDASRSAPRGMVRSVLISAAFGWFFLIAFVIAIPDMDKAAESGFNVFFETLNAVLPAALATVLFVGILIAQFLCGLATVTSCSRMIFAFARDGGLPWSSLLKKVSPAHRTPVAAIWTGAILSFLFTLYAEAYTLIVSVTVIFIFLSYGLPVILGFFAYGKTWTKMGPWTLGPAYKLVAILVFLAICLILYLGVQPPNDNALKITIAFIGLAVILWYGLEKRRFQGPPQGVMIQQRQAEIQQAEKAVGEELKV